MARDGSINSFAGATALVSNLDIQIFVGVAGKTTLDYSAYEDNVSVNLNYQDEATALYDASGLSGVLNIANVIGAGGKYGNDIVGGLGDNIITVANSRGVNRISGGGGNDIIYGNGNLNGGTTEYIGGVESDATLTGDRTTAVLTNTPPGATASTRSICTAWRRDPAGLSHHRQRAAPGSAYHAATLVTLDGSGYSGDLTLIGSAGANVLRGGLGNNTFTGYQGNNDIWAQAGALSNKLSENGSWNFVLTNTGLQATHVDDGLGTNGGAGAVLSNTLHGVFTDAMLNGGLNATLIDASAFSGNTVLVSGLMSGGVIKAGNGANRQHQIILLGGVYDITGGTGLNASTELVAMADGLTGATAAELKADADARKARAGWPCAPATPARAGTAGSSAAPPTSPDRSSATSRPPRWWAGLQQLDRHLRVQGRVSIDGSAGRANTFIIGNAYVSDVIGSAGDNTIRVATGANSLTVTNGRLTFAASGGQTLVSTFTNVNDFAITVQDDGRVVDTTGFTGVTTKTYLSDLKSGYQASNGPALSLLSPPPATPAWMWAWKAYAPSRT